MSKSTSTWLTGLAALGAAHVAIAQPDFDAVEITVHEVAGNVYYLEGAGGNVGVAVGEQGVVLIDDQFAPLTDKLVAAVQSITDARIRAVINTHVHGDHVGGNANLANRGVPVIAHDNVRVRMAQAEQPVAPAGRPILTYPDSALLHLGGGPIRVLELPAAHTDGDSFIHFPAVDVMHVGDVFRTTGYPVIDVGNGGTAAGTLEALQIIIDTAGSGTMLIPGHGELSTRADVVEFRDMIADVEQRVSDLVEQGMSLEQVLAAEPTADLDERWGDPERFLRGLYESLQNESM